MKSFRKSTENLAMSNKFLVNFLGGDRLGMCGNGGEWVGSVGNGWELLVIVGNGL